MAQWRLATLKPLRGNLSSCREFFVNSEEMTGYELQVPIGMNQEVIQTAINNSSSLPTGTIRSFEVWWNGKEIKLVFFSTKNDIETLKNVFENMYPGLKTEKINSVYPEWFSEDVDYEIFDVGLRHGHFFSSFDKTRAHNLITQITKNIQLSKKGWIQFVFKSVDFSKMLSHMTTRLDTRFKINETQKHTSWSDDKTLYDHKEKGRDFSKSYQMLRNNITVKTQSPQVEMSIRGLVEGDIDLDFSVIETIPFENIRSSFEHLVKNIYERKFFVARIGKKFDEKSICQFSDGKSKKKTVGNRIDIFKNRAIPDSSKWVDKIKSHYLGKNIFGYYHKRISQPFLILNNSELGVFIHLPDPRTKHVKINRDVALPQVLRDVEVLGLGWIV